MANEKNLVIPGWRFISLALSLIWILFWALFFYADLQSTISAGVLTVERSDRVVLTSPSTASLAVPAPVSKNIRKNGMVFDLRLDSLIKDRDSTKNSQAEYTESRPVAEGQTVQADLAKKTEIQIHTRFVLVNLLELIFIPVLAWWILVPLLTRIFQILLFSSRLAPVWQSTYVRAGILLSLIWGCFWIYNLDVHLIPAVVNHERAVALGRAAIDTSRGASASFGAISMTGSSAEKSPIIEYPGFHVTQTFYLDWMTMLEVIFLPIVVCWCLVFCLYFLLRFFWRGFSLIVNAFYAKRVKS